MTESRRIEDTDFQIDLYRSRTAESEKLTWERRNIYRVATPAAPYIISHIRNSS